MNELIDTKLVAKLMNKTAKECGMTRDDRCIVSQEVWLAKSREMEKRGAKTPVYYYYRYITKTYDFVADNFLKLLAKKVKAEGFDLADNEVKLTESKATVNIVYGSTYIRMIVAWHGTSSKYRWALTKDTSLYNHLYGEDNIYNNIYTDNN